MKVRMYYLEDSVAYPGRQRTFEKKRLYALTCEKKLAKLFEKQRKMSLFTKKTYEMTKEQYKQMAFEYRASVLEARTFSTFPKKKYMESRDKKFRLQDSGEIACTYMEVQYISETIDNPYDEIFGDGGLFSPYILTEKFLEVMNKLQYGKVYAAASIPPEGIEWFGRNNPRKLPYSLDAWVTKTEDYEFTNPDVWTDELAIFVEKFGHLFQ